MRVSVQRALRLVGSVEAPGDKSISHRALLFAALGEGRSTAPMTQSQTLGGMTQTQGGF